MIQTLRRRRVKRLASQVKRSGMWSVSTVSSFAQARRRKTKKPIRSDATRSIGRAARRRIDRAQKATEAPPKIGLIRFRKADCSGEAVFRCFEEDQVIEFSQGVRNKFKSITEDFDFESDNETIEAAVLAQKRRVLKHFQPTI